MYETDFANVPPTKVINLITNILIADPNDVESPLPQLKTIALITVQIIYKVCVKLGRKFNYAMAKRSREVFFYTSLHIHCQGTGDNFVAAILFICTPSEIQHTAQKCGLPCPKSKQTTENITKPILHQFYGSKF